MAHSKFLKIALVLIGISLISSACGGQSPASAPAAAAGPKPTLVSVGATMEKPVPFGYDIILPEIVLRIDEVMRSDSTVLTDQDGNPVLEDGQEFLLVRITNQCIKPGDNCFVTQNDYQIFDAAGNPITAESGLTGLNELYTPEEFGSGTSKKGLLAFRVSAGDDYSILTYRQFNGVQIYLSLAY